MWREGRERSPKRCLDRTCTTHNTLHTTHFSVHTTHYTLHTTHYTLHTTHYTLLSAHYTLHTTHYTLHTTHYTLHTTHYTLHTGALTEEVLGQDVAQRLRRVEQVPADRCKAVTDRYKTETHIYRTGRREETAPCGAGTCRHHPS